MNNSKKFLLYFFLCIYLLLTGCATDKAFVRPNDAVLLLGKTTRGEIIKTYGEPTRSGVLSQNNASMSTISYTNARAIPFTTIISSRAIVLVIHDDVLVGYDFTSSYDDDQILKDQKESLLQKIKNGDSKNKILSLIGKPDGEGIYPLTSKKGNTTIRYNFLTTSRIPFNPKPKISSKSTTIEFNEDGIVSDIKIVENSSK
jgi:hypothetical protein